MSLYERLTRDERPALADGLPIPRREILRYLGIRTGQAPVSDAPVSDADPDALLIASVGRCEALLRSAAHPAAVLASHPLEIAGSAEDPVARFAGMEVHSMGLCRNLRGCRSIVMLAATLGIGPDRLAARTRLSSISDAAILQAAGAAMIESYVDLLNEEVRAQAAQEGLYARPRFSPGYGDFALSHQTAFFEALMARREIGITLTDSLLMIPSKSVTAVIGLSDEETPCPLSGCESCSLPECAFRR